MTHHKIIRTLGLICSLAFWLTRTILGAQSSELGRAYWQPDGVPLCLALGRQGIPHVTSDDDAGLITTWTDCRPSPIGCDIYAQRVAKDGNVLWHVDGLPVSAAPGDQLGPRTVGDNEGGALIAWSDYRNAPEQAVYAQRLDGLGNRVWNSDGITVTIGSDNRAVLELVPDTLGGAFVIWEAWSGQPTTDLNLFAQHLDQQGHLLWSAPVTVTAAPNQQYYGDSASDGAGGMLVTWSDLRDAADPDIYAQHISSEGEALWTSDGILVSPDPALQRPGHIISDGQGGAYIAWYDFRSNSHLADAYLQRLTSAGTPAWKHDLPVVAHYDYAEGPDDLIPDGSGGAILISTRDIYGVVETDVMAQRVNSAGERLWGTEPVNVTPWEAQQGLAVATPDGEGGAYIAWIDKYADRAAYDILTQHIAANGTRSWPGHGVQAVDAAGMQGDIAITNDGHYGFIVAWQDYRNGQDNPDLYAQRIGDAVVTRYFLPLIQKMAMMR